MQINGYEIKPYADLREADLRGANLREVDLREANLPYYMVCPEVGDFIAWGKKGKKVVKLLIPAEAKRNSSLVGRKCRAEFAKVLEIDDGKMEEVVSDSSKYGGIDTVYRVGEIVRPDSYDLDIRIECSNGIHFFISRKEAENFK